MKRIVALFLVVLMVFSISACKSAPIDYDNSDKNVSEPESYNPTNKDNVSHSTNAGVEFEVLSCAFDKEIMGIDEEFSTYGYTEKTGKVYVNLTLKIKNNSTENFTEDKISGSFEYNNSTYNLQYSVALTAPKNVDDIIQPGYIGVVNMFSLLDESAVNENITINYTVDGNNYSQKVSALDTRKELDKKTELKIGDKVNIDGFYEIEVISCSEEKDLRPTNSQNGFYYVIPEDKKVIDLIVKIKNNSDVDLYDILGYVVLDNGDIIRAGNRAETQDGKDLTFDYIKPGEERYVHIYVSVDKNTKTEGLAMRMRIAYNCYYVMVK